jgi:hypothetical protein
VPYEKQKVIGGGIVDFYIPRLQLVLEVDGKHHLEPCQLLSDADRTRMIRKALKGTCVIRAPNRAVLHIPTAREIAQVLHQADLSEVPRLQEMVERIVWVCGIPGAREWISIRRRAAEGPRGASAKGGTQSNATAHRRRRRQPHIKSGPGLTITVSPSRPTHTCENPRCWGRSGWKARTHVEVGGLVWHVCERCGHRLTIERAPFDPSRPMRLHGLGAF